MTTNRMTTRGVSFAFLFGPPRIITRTKASELHGLVCDSLHLDDLLFQYAGSTEQVSQARSFAVRIERREGRGGLFIGIDQGMTNAPLRLLMDYKWPASLVHAKETFDDVSKAVLGAMSAPCQKVLAEVRLRAECGLSHGPALKYHQEHVLALSKEWLAGFGQPLSFCSVRFETPSTNPGDNPLAGPARELQIENLRDDPSKLYLELMSQWPQFPAATAPGAIDLSTVRSFEVAPSEYVDETYAFLQARIKDLPCGEKAG